MTLAKDRNEGYNKSIFGRETSIINIGMDKWADGLMYSALLCTKATKNNSPKRRRPIAFAERPAIESVYNVSKLLEPMMNELLLLKDNSSALLIGNECAIITCFTDNKYGLDQWKRQQTGVNLLEFPKSMLEAEELKRKSHWNLSDYNTDKLYILDISLNAIITASMYSYPESFICVESQINVDKVYVYKRQHIINNNQAQYAQIGCGKFWNGAIDFEEDEIIQYFETRYFAVNADTNSKLIQLVLHDGGDLAGLDARYNLGTHSCTYFCLYCQTDSKTAVCDFESRL